MTKNSVKNIIFFPFVIQCEKTVLLKDSWLPGETVQWEDMKIKKYQKLHRTKIYQDGPLPPPLTSCPNHNKLWRFSAIISFQNQSVLHLQTHIEVVVHSLLRLLKGFCSLIILWQFIISCLFVNNGLFIIKIRYTGIPSSLR